MKRVGIILGGAALIGLLAITLFFSSWWRAANVAQDTVFMVSQGDTLTAVANRLEERGVIGDADRFLLAAKIFGASDPVQAGEFNLPVGVSPSQILGIMQSGNVVRQFITIPEGMPSIMVYERLMAEPLLDGEIPIPVEGSVLPDTYDFERGEDRMKVLARMQVAMRTYLAEAWPKRTADIAVKSVEEAVVLASIVEKETGIASERRKVAGLYSNRVKAGMLLQADPTIIYPITKGKPLGRRIRQSEIAAVNDYNTYTMTGLPKGPITNPGRAAIAAVLDPEETSALYMVADGKGGHIFGDTLAEHNANVEQWFALRRERGEM
ncbi:endolytic transglycosylase MltG [Pontixanthobacter sp.]|uniref:endolytic transglycosylase MltG n=1 Tax=Pontixanthobacter sp. TaxID=2792078 RepID=UPI003C7A9F48